MCRYGLRQLKAESNASLYVTSMCRLFFTSLIDTATEFLKAFPQHLGCFSSQFSLYINNSNNNNTNIYEVQRRTMPTLKDQLETKSTSKAMQYWQDVRQSAQHHEWS